MLKLIPGNQRRQHGDGGQSKHHTFLRGGIPNNVHNVHGELLLKVQPFNGAMSRSDLQRLFTRMLPHGVSDFLLDRRGGSGASPSGILRNLRRRV
jgi:hypothetical protein